MSRIGRDQLGLLLAHAWALRGTCARRRVGCVLMDAAGYELATGYNGPAAGQPHCSDAPCRGAGLPSGAGLELCEAIHAEANALMRCRDVREVFAAYVTHSPCLHCVKLLMNTGCRRIVFSEPYAHDDQARALWTAPDPLVRWNGIVIGGRVMPDLPRTWEHVRLDWRVESEADVFRDAR